MMKKNLPSPSMGLQRAPKLPKVKLPVLPRPKQSEPKAAALTPQAAARIRNKVFGK